MLNFKSLCLCCVITVIVLIKNGWSIKCWECRSDLDPKCADPFDNVTFIMSDCRHIRMDWMPEVEATMCRKTRQKVHGVWKYIRSCAYLGEPGIQGDERFCLMRTGTYNIFMEYCTCNAKDGCNVASTLIIAPILLIAGALSFIYLR